MKFEIKNRFTGSVLFEAELGSLMLVVQAAVKAKADLRGADLRGADLRGAYLRGADLGGADLRGAYLRGADLGGADLGGAYLRGAYLRGADLRGADLGGAYLRGAYLRGADLGGADLIDAGQDSRGYRFVAVRQKKGPYLIFAGCHTFTLEAALKHWGDRHEAVLRAECMAKIELIKTVAEAREWEAEGEPVKLGPQPEEDADTQDGAE